MVLPCSRLTLVNLAGLFLLAPRCWKPSRVSERQDGESSHRIRYVLETRLAFRIQLNSAQPFLATGDSHVAAITGHKRS